MTLSNVSTQRAGVSVSGPPHPWGGLRFDYLMVTLSAWFLGGLYADGWAHHQHLVDSFFTPWHGILYSGYFVAGFALLLTLLRNRWRGASWQQALPAGYGLALAGFVLFIIGGVFDLLWHTLFGIEADVEALLSPSHLLLAFAMLLMVTGPLRAAWNRTDPAVSQGWLRLLPMLLALSYTLLLFGFFTEFAHPFAMPLAQVRGVGETDISLGAASVLLQTALLMGVVLVAVRHWTLPAGSLTLLLTLNTFLAVLAHGEYRFIPAAIGAGLVGDLFLQYLHAAPAHTRRLRLFAFAVPVILYLLYFLTVQFSGGIAWSIHLWLGVTLMAGVVGLLLSYLIVPPALGRPEPRS